MSDSINQIPTGYLNLALSLGMDAANAFLVNIHHNNENCATSIIHLKPIHDGTYIIPYQKRNSTTKNIFYVISMDGEYAYAMLATLESSPIRIQLRTLINTLGTNHSQIIHIQIKPHTRNVLGRTYLTPCIQDLVPHISLPTYDHTKGIIGRRMDKMHWAIILLHNIDTLEIYEAALRQSPAEQYDHQTTTTQFARTPTDDMPRANARGGKGGRGARPRPTKTPIHQKNNANSNMHIGVRRHRLNA